MGPGASCATPGAARPHAVVQACLPPGRKGEGVGDSQEEDIPCFVADRHTSVIDGSLNWLQMRVMVPEEREVEARELLTEAELGHWLKARK